MRPASDSDELATIRLTLWRKGVSANALRLLHLLRGFRIFLLVLEEARQLELLVLAQQGS